jgi:natural product precursor
MKLLTKLVINPEKVMKNEELLTLKGGFSCTCTCYDSGDMYCYGYLLSEDGDCPTTCNELWSGSTGQCGNLYEQCSNQPG